MKHTLGAVVCDHRCRSSSPSSEIAAAALDARDVVLAERPLFAGADGRERTARLLLAWSWRESAWKADALGDCVRALVTSRCSYAGGCQ